MTGTEASKPRVHVIDDELAIGRLFTRPHFVFGHKWDVVHDDKPTVALQRLQHEDELFDVILLDIIMPDMNGIELWDDLATLAPARRDRVVFMTGGGLIPAVGDFLALRHHVEKPFSIEEIEGIVRVYSELPVSRGPW